MLAPFKWLLHLKDKAEEDIQYNLEKQWKSPST